MITENQIIKLKNYFSIANKAGYVIWGVDNLKDYTHKLYLIIYRSDFGKTILKTLKHFDNKMVKIEIDKKLYDEITSTDKSKILAIKNFGLANKIIEILRGEDGESRKDK